MVRSARWIGWLLVSLTLAWPVGARGQAAETDWVERYGGLDRVIEVTQDEHRLFDEVRLAMIARGAEPCRASARLTLAARAHARSLISTGTARRLEPSMVRRELLRVGGVDPVVVPWAIAARDNLDLSSSRERLSERFGQRPPTHCGVGVADRDGRIVAVVVGVRRHLELEPFPARLTRGDRARLEGRLSITYRSPSVVVTAPTGEVLRQRTLRRAGRFGAWLSFETPGRYTVEIMADGPQGPEIVALFPVFVDTPPALGGRERPAPGGDDRWEESPATDLLRRLNHERRRAGLSPLRADPQLTLVARDHSLDMVRRRYFGHVSPSGIDLTDRLARAGLATYRAAENLVRGVSPARAHAQLMESPAHRANLLDPDLTHVGIGVIEHDGELVVTEIFVAW